MITNIQVLRALAALAVVFYHTGYLLNGGVHTDFQGVAVFFVISGFIIPRVGYKNSRDFLLHRFIRIVPIYWLATLADLSWFTGPQVVRVSLMAFCVALALLPAELVDKFLRKHPTAMRAAKIFVVAVVCYFIDFFARGMRHLPPATVTLLLKSLAFIPARDINGDIHPYLGVGWTLNMEIFFYAIFGISLAINKKIAPVLTAVVLIAFRYLYKTGVLGGVYGEFYAHDYIQFFVYGMILHYAYGVAETISASRLRDRKIVAFVGFAAAATGTLFVLSNLRPQSFAMPYGPVFVVAAALACHLVGIRNSDASVLLVGNASYVLYLFHIFFIETIRGLSERFPILTLDTPSGMAFVLVVCTLSAVTIHRYVELPQLAFLRSRLRAAEPVKRARILSAPS